MVNENGKEKMIELILFLRIVFSTSFLVSIFSLLVLCFLMRSRSDEKRNKQVENMQKTMVNAMAITLFTGTIFIFVITYA